MNFYKHFMGDYAKKTAHLTLIQHGAYRMLLDAYYSMEKPLPADYDALYRISRAMDLKERDAVRSVSDEFFPVCSDGFRHNERADEEIEKRGIQASINKGIGKLGGRPRKTDSVIGFETEHETESVIGRDPNDNPSHSQSQKEQVPNANALGVAGATRPQKIPDCPQKQLIDLYHELLPECPRVIEWNDGRQALMRSRWREKAKPNGVTKGYVTETEGIAWWHRYFSYCSKSKFLIGQVDGRDGARRFVANLEWLIRPKNFAKVMDGNYHGD